MNSEFNKLSSLSQDSIDRLEKWKKELKKLNKVYPDLKPGKFAVLDLNNSKLLFKKGTPVDAQELLSGLFRKIYTQ